MADTPGDKSEKPTEKRLSDARQKGQVARSQDLQTLAVLTVATNSLSLSGEKMFVQFSEFMQKAFSELHTTELTTSGIQAQLGTIMTFTLMQVSPIVLPVLVIGVLAAGLQTKFQIASKALEFSPSKMNPIKGLKKIFNVKQLIPTALGIVKLVVIIASTYSAILSIINDPIFFVPSDVGRLGPFISGVTLTILSRICTAMLFIALIDFMYQKWQTTKSMMMSKEEIKDETKNSEGNPKQKARQRQVRVKSFREMLEAVPTADAIITNPTHLAIAIKYDRETMKAPQIIAKGARNKALKIREIAKANQIPIIEDKPVARMLFKYGRVDGEIPNQLFTAVAEILAYVYRINAYRYYRDGNK